MKIVDAAFIVDALLFELLTAGLRLFEEDGDTKYYTARRLRSCLVPTADSAVVSRAKKPPPVKEQPRKQWTQVKATVRR